ncbi:hypothetical protein [Cytobacillus praedii]|uniref:hypothetical protein n=1 Tax=Cytobacillus praedii TaxID=1742358 RepID=UPI002E1D43ED|nr:hypothetical protein [Cytobacillus praedii]
MRKLKEQGGYALLIVLLAVTLIGIFTPLIFSKLMNSTQQFQKTEQGIQLHKLSEMGTVYVENAISVAGNHAKEGVTKWIKQKDPTKPAPTNQEISEYFYRLFTAELGNYIPSPSFIKEMSDPKYKFKMAIDSISLGNSTLDVSYTITPSLNNQFDGKNERKGNKAISINISN